MVRPIHEITTVEPDFDPDGFLGEYEEENE